jgi:multisubunit Na+/H+ antiporter MnhB subunit
MSGLMEILLIVVIALGIFVLPRLLAGRPEKELHSRVRFFKLSGWMRLAVMVSFLWPALLALYLKPWSSHHWSAFFYVAVGPVTLTWGIFWVVSGFRKKGF